jgi:hypothetical protein
MNAPYGVWDLLSLYVKCENNVNTYVLIIYNKFIVMMEHKRKLLEKEFPLIPEYQIKNLTECTTDELLFELGYCDWLIKQEHDLEYAYQLKTLIVNNLLKIKINYV